MADRELSDSLKFRKVKSLDLSDGYSSEQIRSSILSSNEPLKLTEMLRDWPCSRWTPELLASELGFLQTSFRISAKMDSPYYAFDKSKVVMESDCLYAKASLGNYCAWLSGDVQNAGELSKYSR